MVGAIWLGAPWLTLLALLGGGLAIREFYRLTPPGVGPMPVALGVLAVSALLLTAQASSGSDFHTASGLALAAWAFVALLWFIACYREEQPSPEDSLAPETGAPETGAEEDESEGDEPPYYGLYFGVFCESRESGGLEANWRPVGVSQDDDPDEPDDEGLYGNSGDFEPDDEPDADAEWGKRPWHGFLFLLLGPVYAGFLLGHGLAIRDLSGDSGDLGRSWLLFTLLAVFACDTGALVAGRLLGRHRMVPRISPNKTWEGAAGGFAASVGAALLVGLVFDLAAPLWQQALIGAVAGLAAQSGDLVESVLKRAANVKDSGSIMPGHGGILDRMDSILFALPAVYYMLMAAGFPL